MSAAIKPWGKAVVVGNTIAAAALGIGLRWRETVVEIVERRESPFYESSMMRRCVIPQNSIRLLVDLGATEANIRRVLTPAKKWKLVTHALDVMKEGESHPHCAPSEAVFHTRDGALLRALRSDFSRFGGVVCWGTEAFDPFPAMDDSGLYHLRREWGNATEVELLASTARRDKFFRDAVFAKGATPIETVGFDVSEGWTTEMPADLGNAFGRDYDVILVLGRELVIHVWRASKEVVAWKRVTRPGADNTAAMQELHPALRAMMSASKNAVHDTIAVPLGSFPFNDKAEGSRVTLMQDGLLAVDPFNWRGDDALLAIEDSVNLVDRLFKQKFQRGNVARELRQWERDAMAKRVAVLQRDLRDAEMFLAVKPELPREEDDEPEAAKLPA